MGVHDQIGDSEDILGAIEDFLTTTATATPSTERVLASVLFAVRAASDEQVSESADARWNKSLAAFHDGADRIVEQRDGHTISCASDRFMATFSGPARPGPCRAGGLAIRDMIRVFDLDLRVGVHTAEIELRADGIEGIGVDIGEHVANLAEVGEVWVSRTVRDLTAGSGLHFDARGRHRVGGIDEEWELFAVTS